MAARRLVKPPATRAATADAVWRSAAMAALVRIGSFPFRTPGKKDKPFQSSGIRAGWF
jgi:hypothetical protein